MGPPFSRCCVTSQHGCDMYIDRITLRALGGLDLTGKAAVLKTAVREHIGVRVPGPP